MFDSESLYEAWERFKNLQRKCPHHGIPDWLIVQTFYNGVSEQFKSTIDAAAGGAIMNKLPTQATQLLEEMAANNYNWSNERNVSKKAAGIYGVDNYSLLASKVDAIAKSLEHANLNIAHVAMVCELCGGGHHFSECHGPDHVNFVNNSSSQQNNPYSNSYNPGWRNHPNFSWSNQGGQKQSFQGTYHPRNQQQN